MDPASLFLLIICIILTAVTAYFTSAETAYSSVNILKIKGLVESGDKRAGNVVDLLEDFDRILITVLLGTNLAQIALSACFTLLIIHLWGSKYVFEATLLLTVVQFIFAEMIPKRIARNNSTRVSLRHSGSIQVIIRFFSPVTRQLAKLTDWLSDILGEEPPVVNENELEDMVEAVSDTQTHSQADLLRSAVRYDDTRAESIMTRMDSVITISADLSDEEVLSAVRRSRHSRLPVTDNDGRIIGILNIRSYLKFYLKNNTCPSIKNVMESPFFAFPTVLIDELLRTMSAEKKNLAVIGTAGDPVGIVTIEDILEELVGEIYDEDDYIPRGGRHNG